MDITNFITWFISQVVKIFTWLFNLLDSITFSGTSLLRVIITIIIISVLLPVILTIGKNSRVIAERSDSIRSSKEKEKHDAKES